MTGLLNRVSFPQHRLPGRDCPACGADGLRAFYAVTSVPAATERFATTADEAEAAPAGDVTLALCETCGFVTNTAFRPADDAGHDDRPPAASDLLLANQWADRYALHGKTIVEMGCGQGHFLEALCQAAGARGIGFDPLVRREQNEHGNVLFVAGDYADFAAEVRADFVFSRNGLVNVAQPLAYLTRVRAGLIDTPIVMEVPDHTPQLRDGAFWDIAPEQASHFTAGAMTRLLQRAGFEPTRTLVDDGRQSLVVEAEPTGGQKRDMPTLSELRLTSQFTRVCSTRMREWLAFAEAAGRSGKRCLLWGDAVRATRFLGPLGIADAFVACVDANVQRQGRYLPGTRLRVEPPAAINALRPDVVVATHQADRPAIAAALEAAGLTAKTLCLDAGVADSRDH